MYGLNHGMTLDSLPDDVMLPVQFFERLRQNAHQDGYHRLIYAVLEEALRIYCNGRVTIAGYAGPSKRNRLFQEARTWLFDEDDEGPFSCAWICEYLGIEVAWFRKGLRAWDATARPALTIARRSPVGGRPRRPAAIAAYRVRPAKVV